MACNGITHEEKIYVLACDIAKAVKEENTDQVRVGLYVLTKMVTEEDIKKAIQLGYIHIQKCQCPLCKVASKFVPMPEAPPSDESFAV